MLIIGADCQPGLSTSSFLGIAKLGNCQSAHRSATRGHFYCGMTLGHPTHLTRPGYRCTIRTVWAEPAAVNTVRVVEATLLCSPELIARRSPSVRMSVAKTFFGVLACVVLTLSSVANAQWEATVGAHSMRSERKQPCVAKVALKMSFPGKAVSKQQTFQNLRRMAAPDRPSAPGESCIWRR